MIAETATPTALLPDATATAPRSRKALQHIFSFRTVHVVLLIMMAVITFRGRFNATDTWWDLKTGEIVWNTHRVPTVDLFSYTTNRHFCVPHEWLAQLSIYAAYHFGGYLGMAIWFCIFVSLLSFAAYVLCRMYSGSDSVAFLGALGIWFFATIGFSIRAQLIGYLLLLCELLILQLARTRDARWFFALPPLFALWVNIHGSFLLGLVVLGVVLACGFLEFQAGLLVSHRWPLRERKLLIAVFALSVGALFINPVGLPQLTYPIDTMFNQPLQKTFISEWPPAPFTDPRAWGLLAAAGVILLIPLVKQVEFTVQELLLVAMGFAMAAQHQRMLFVFGILAMPVLSRLVAVAWNQRETNRRRERVLLNAVVIAVAIFATVRLFPTTHNLTEQVNQGNPAKALAFLRHADITGRMLNDYNYGGYLIWAAPERKVFADGRGDVYEWTGILADYIKLVTLQVDPRSILDKYRIDYCLLNRGAAISRLMELIPGWKSAYSDNMSVVLVRTSPLKSSGALIKARQ